MATTTTTSSGSTAPAASDGARAPRRRRSARPDSAAWFFLGPFLALFGFAFVLPIGYAVYQSMLKVERSGPLGLGEPTVGFAGLENYTLALQQTDFVESFGRVLLFGIVQVPLMLLLALTLALLLDQLSDRWAGLLRASYFLPVRHPRRHRHDPVGLPVRAGGQPDLRGAGRRGARIPRLRQRVVVHREHRDVGVRGLQHAHHRRPAASRSRRSCSRRRGSTAPGPGRRLCGSRSHWCVRRWCSPASSRSSAPCSCSRSRSCSGSSPPPSPATSRPTSVRTTTPSPTPTSIWPPRRPCILAARRLRAVVRLPQPGHPQGKEPAMSATTASEPVVPPGPRHPRGRAAGRAAPRAPPGRILLVGLAGRCGAGYFLLPVYWLVVAATKTTAQRLRQQRTLVRQPAVAAQPRQGPHLRRRHLPAAGCSTRCCTRASARLLATLLAAAAGFALAKYRFRGREAAFKVVLAGVLLPPPRWLCRSTCCSARSAWPTPTGRC